MTHGGYAAPGWYPDASGVQHYWDGSQWTSGPRRTGSQDDIDSRSGGGASRPRRRFALPSVVGVVTFVLGIGVGAAVGPSAADPDVAALTEERDQALAELEQARAAQSDDEEPADDGTTADPAAEEPAAPEQAEREPAEDVDQGTREHPFAIGDAVTNDDWEVTLGEPREAGTEVADENPFNEPAPDGMEFWIVPVTATYIGDETGLPWIDLEVRFVGSDGRTYSDYCGVIPDDLQEVDELYADATAEGNTCVVVPTGADGLWTLAAGWSDPVFFSTSN